jgi:large subunit ribosomal protein L19
MKAKRYTKETIRELGVTQNSYPKFDVGDTIIVSQRIKEGDKERIQDFEGDVIAMRKHGASSTFTIRKIGANNVAVERIFPFYTPLIESITFKRKGSVRRSKLYYVRARIGRAARIQEEVVTKLAKEPAKKQATL